MLVFYSATSSVLSCHSCVQLSCLSEGEMPALWTHVSEVRDWSSDSPASARKLGVARFLIVCRRFIFSASPHSGICSDSSDLQFLRTRNRGCRLDRHCRE